MRVMEPDECLRRLHQHGVGRIGFAVRDQPLVLPVNYTMDGRQVVFRSDHGTKLQGVVGRPCAFEIDETDAVYHEGWSVLVVGRAEEVTEPHEIERLAKLPLGPWEPGPKAHWVRIRPGSITGREIYRVAD
jgi:nitroimidazol reductase NimA-like FMN-containing flavoprotein (pyridoxamine 5'-phosphate oxidase superfamily)